jgi:hypothetical protein
MWNLPGCLPEMEPQSFDSWEAAQASLLDELQSLDDDCEEETDPIAEEARDCFCDVSDLATGDEWCGSVGNYVFSLSEGELE